MKLAKSLFCLMILIAGLAAGANTVTISGTVHDRGSKPVAGVVLTLTDAQTPPSTKRTTSGPAGEYEFTGLDAGRYTLTAAAEGFSAATLPVDVSTAINHVTVLVTLSKGDAQKLEFQASGLRGLIDPGGYSAPANAAAATDLLHGMADIKRSGSFGGPAAKDWPCSVAPALQQELAAHPKAAEANRKLGDFYLAHDDVSHAIPLLQNSVQAAPSNLRASLDLAIAYMHNGQFDAARKLLAPLAERPNQPEAHQLLAGADEGSGMFQQAAEQYRIADLDQSSEANVLGVGYELVLAGAPADALNIYLSGEKKYPRSIELRIGAGSAQFLLGNAAGAIQSFLAAAAINPADPRPYPFLAAASDASAAEADQVAHSFERYAERNPNDTEANYFYAHVLFHQDADANAARIERLLKQTLQLEPRMAKAHLQLAELYARRKDDQQALSEYESAVRLAPDLMEAHYRLALACKRVGRADEAAEEMRIFLQAKARASNTDEDAIDITRFLSVIDTPAEPATADTRCP
jgi:Flp pilus assembly protein TadD